MSTSRRSVVRLLASATAGLALVPGCAPKGGSGGTGGGSAGTGGDDGILGAGTGGAGPGGGTGGGDECAPTAGDVEGPYYTAGAPAVVVLAAADEPGTRIRIDGVVVDAADCETPLPGSVVDLWHADDSGEYDNAGYRLRGIVTADQDGAFVVETILPGRYSSRPVRHIHFKVWSAGGAELLTSQIYFGGDESLDPAVHTGPVVALDGAGGGQLMLAVPDTA